MVNLVKNAKNRKILVIAIVVGSSLFLLVSSQFFATAPIPSAITLTIQPKGMIGILNPTLTVTAKSNNPDYAISGLSATIIGQNGWESSLYTATFTNNQYQISQEVTLPQIQSYTIRVSIRWYDDNKPPGDNQFSHIKEEPFTVNPEGEETVVSGTTVQVVTTQNLTLPDLETPLGELASIDVIAILLGFISFGTIMRYKRKQKDVN